MATWKVLTIDGAKHLISVVKGLIATKVDKVEGKGLSTNDFTDEYKGKLDNVEAGGQVNVIESVVIDGVAQNIADKQVTLDLSNYALKADLVNAVDFKGVVATYEALQAVTGMENGDVYHVTEKSAEYIYIAEKSAWEELGSILDLSAYSTTEQMNTAIQQAIAGKADKSYVDEQLALKANASDVETEVSALETAIAGKVAQTAYDAKMTALDEAIAGKADASHTHAIADVTGLQDALDAKAVAANVYTKAETDAAIDADVKVVSDALATLEGNVYTKAQVDSAIETATDDMATNAGVDAKLANYVLTSDLVAITNAEIDAEFAAA